MHTKRCIFACDLYSVYQLYHFTSCTYIYKQSTSLWQPYSENSISKFPSTDKHCFILHWCFHFLGIYRNLKVYRLKLFLNFQYFKVLMSALMVKEVWNTLLMHDKAFDKAWGDIFSMYHILVRYIAIICF
jgi:hypothetical protein